MSERIFFESWAGLGRTLLVSVLAYAALVLILRLSGKRTLSKMNAFDLIVTVALGSTLATVLLSKDVPLAEGVLAFAVLVGLQYVLAWMSSRSEKVLAVIKSEPALLFLRGEPLHEALRRERVAEVELLAAIRNEGYADVQDVEAVVLETDGTFSVIRKGGQETPGSLKNVSRYPEDRRA